MIVSGPTESQVDVRETARVDEKKAVRIIFTVLTLLVLAMFLVAGRVLKIGWFKDKPKNTRNGVSQTTPDSWKLTWLKPPGTPTRKNQDGGSYPASIVRNDDTVMEIVVTYEKGRKCRFFWDKTRGATGEWSQATPKDEGVWWLKETSSGHRFTGALTDTASRGAWLPFELVKN